MNDDNDLPQDQTAHDDKHQVIMEKKEELEEDDPSRDVTDVDQARKDAGMGNDDQGPREVTDADDLNKNAHSGEG